MGKRIFSWLTCLAIVISLCLAPTIARAISNPEADAKFQACVEKAKELDHDAAVVLGILLCYIGGGFEEMDECFAFYGTSMDEMAAEHAGDLEGFQEEVNMMCNADADGDDIADFNDETPCGDDAIEILVDGVCVLPDGEEPDPGDTQDETPGMGDIPDVPDAPALPAGPNDTDIPELDVSNEAWPAGPGELDADIDCVGEDCADAAGAGAGGCSMIAAGSAAQSAASLLLLVAGTCLFFAVRRRKK